MFEGVIGEKGEGGGGEEVGDGGKGWMDFKMINKKYRIKYLYINLERNMCILKEKCRF